MTSDAELMEASLVAIDGREADMRAALFDRFFEHYPERRAIFLHVEATAVRMTDEALQWMLGLASGADWVWGQVAELVYQHGNYGHLTQREYDLFTDLAVEELGKAAGDSWTPDCAAAWGRAADSLKAMVERAIREWTASPLPYP
jgi:hemoglobin-like flavoprotein